MKRIRKHILPLWGSLLFAVLLAGAVTLLALWCQPNALRQVLGQFRAQPLLIVLNALPVGLLLLALAFLFRNVCFGAALTNLLVCGFSIANRIKIQVRDEPVFPRDLGLLKEVGSAMGSYDIRYPWGAIAAVLLTTLLLIALGLFVTGAPCPVKRLRGWPGRVLGALGSLGVLAALILTVYASNDLYNSFSTSNPYYVPSVFNELGFPYCFCHHFTTYAVDRPEGFDRNQAAEWAAEPADSTPGDMVHVVLVMNEAFSDVSDHPAFAYTAETEPLPHLQALRSDPHALTGHVVVPGFAGGTANTEFDVLTGIQTNGLSVTSTSAMRVVNRNLDSLFRAFARDGYAASYFHPGDNWFYNRENVMAWMGAEETVFAGQMEDPAYKGRWVTDDYMAGLIEQAVADAAARGETLFNFTTTIQNHMSYTENKYGEGYVFPPLELSPGVTLSDQARTLLEVYIEGARDADAMLGRLVSTFSASREPVVLLFWGDHLPYLGDDQLAYRELGMDVDALTGFETPYVLWVNDAAADALDWTDRAMSLDLSGEVSASFLGAAVLELTGRDGQSPWFRFLNQLRREAPVVQRETLLLPDGTLTQTPSPDLAARISQWRQWSYYKLKYEDLPAAGRKGGAS